MTPEVIVPKVATPEMPDQIPITVEPVEEVKREDEHPRFVETVIEPNPLLEGDI